MKKNPVSLHHVIVVLLALCVSVFSGIAQSDELDNLEDEFLGDIALPTVLTGTRLAQPQSEVPSSQTVITRAMIEAAGVREIPLLLRLVPGFQVAHETDLVSVTYHGNADVYSRRLQVLVDGRSVYSPLFGGVDWHDLPLSIDDIERIEVTRGPNGVTYGANSFIGVINIITMHPDLAQGNRVKVEGGNRGVRRLSYRHGGKNEKHSYRMTLEGMSDDYFEGVADEKTRQQVNIRGEYRARPVDTFSYQLGFRSGETTKGDGDDNDPFRKEDITGHYQQLGWSHQINNDEAVKLTFSHNYHRVDDVWDVIVPIPEFLLEAPAAELGLPTAGGNALVPYRFSLSGFEERYNLELQHTIRLARNIRAVWGGEARLDQVSGIHDFGYFNTSDIWNNHLYRLFGNMEWASSKDLLVNVGAMIESNDVTGSNISPQIAVNYHINHNQTIRANISRAYRTPSAFEDAANGTLDLTGIVVFPFNKDVLFLGNPDLDPEQMTSYEIGYLMNLPVYKMQMDVRLFHEQVRDLASGLRDDTIIDADMTVGPTYMTAGKTDTTGIEVQLGYRPDKRTNIWLAYSYAELEGDFVVQRREDETLRLVDVSDSVPKHTISLLLSRKFKQNLDVSLGYYNVSDMKWHGGGDDTGGYHTVDFRIAKGFKTKKFKGKAEFIVQDATGSYFDFDDHYYNDPRALLSLELNF